MTRSSLKDRYLKSDSRVSIHSGQFVENLKILANTIDSHVFPVDFPPAIVFKV
jgi:hypothetical protein